MAELKEYFQSLKYDKLPTKASEFIKSQLLTDDDIDLLDENDEDFLEVKSLIESQYPTAISGAEAKQSYADFEREITNMLIKGFAVTIGDAQGMIEAQQSAIENAWNEGLSASDTFFKIFETNAEPVVEKAPELLPTAEPVITAPIAEPKIIQEPYLGWIEAIDAWNDLLKDRADFSAEDVESWEEGIATYDDLLSDEGIKLIDGKYQYAEGFADGGLVSEREEQIKKILTNVEYPISEESLKDLSKKTGYSQGDILYVLQKINNDLQYNVEYAKGGRVDLFEDYENIPEKVQKILDKYSDEFGGDGSDMDYKDTGSMLKEVEAEGYTFGYGLDNEPYGLRPIGVKLNELRDYEDFDENEYANGGGVGEDLNLKRHKSYGTEVQIINDNDEHGFYQEIGTIKGFVEPKFYVVKFEGDNSEYTYLEEELGRPKYAKGGSSGQIKPLEGWEEEKLERLKNDLATYKQPDSGATEAQINLKEGQIKNLTKYINKRSSTYAEAGEILSTEERERLSVLQAKEDLDNLTESENKEYEFLVEKYRKTKEYKGGTITKEEYQSLLSEHDRLTEMFMDIEEDFPNNPTKRAEYKSKINELESKINRYERNYGNGGTIGKHKYKLGDKYRSDFDHEGLLQAGLKSNVSWGTNKLTKLYKSFVDMNYHPQAKITWSAIELLKADKKDLAEFKIEELHLSIEAEIKDIDGNYAGGGSIETDIKDLEKNLYKAEKRYRKAIQEEQVGIISATELEKHKEKVTKAREKVNDWYSTRPIKNKLAEGGGTDNPHKFTFMMLSRLQSDNDYFLKAGGGYEKHLWAGNVDAQITEMKKLWNSLPNDKKPEWLSMEDIQDYEQKMKNYNSGSTHLAEGGTTEEVNTFLSYHSSKPDANKKLVQLRKEGYKCEIRTLGRAHHEIHETK